MVIKKAVPKFCCEVCKADYEDQKSAARCEKMPTNKLPEWITKGKEVVSDFYCGHCHMGFTVGKIKKIVGPTLPINDLEVHYIRKPARRGMHVYYLHVVARCGCCKRKHKVIKAPCEVQENKRF